MHLTPDILRAAYEFLRATPPFRGWRLPDGDRVSFRVMRHKDRFGQAAEIDGVWVIDVSARLVGTTSALLRTMAHEMIHVHGGVTGSKTWRNHGARFQRRAASVCRHHGFDLKEF